MDGFQLCQLSPVTYLGCFDVKPKLTCDLVFFSKYCKSIETALRYFSWLISFWTLEKFLFMKPDYEYILYSQNKIYYPTSTVFLRKKVQEGEIPCSAKAFKMLDIFNAM